MIDSFTMHVGGFVGFSVLAVTGINLTHTNSHLQMEKDYSVHLKERADKQWSM